LLTKNIVSNLLDHEMNQVDVQEMFSFVIGSYQSEILVGHAVRSGLDTVYASLGATALAMSTNPEAIREFAW